MVTLDFISFYSLSSSFMSHLIIFTDQILNYCIKINLFILNLEISLKTKIMPVISKLLHGVRFIVNLVIFLVNLYIKNHLGLGILLVWNLIGFRNLIGLVSYRF